MVRLKPAKAERTAISGKFLSQNCHLVSFRQGKNFKPRRQKQLLQGRKKKAQKKHHKLT